MFCINDRQKTRIPLSCTAVPAVRWCAGLGNANSQESRAGNVLRPRSFRVMIQIDIRECAARE